MRRGRNSSIRGPVQVQYSAVSNIRRYKGYWMMLLTYNRDHLRINSSAITDERSCRLNAYPPSAPYCSSESSERTIPVSTREYRLAFVRSPAQGKIRPRLAHSGTATSRAIQIRMVVLFEKPIERWIVGNMRLLKATPPMAMNMKTTIWPGETSSREEP